MNPALQNIHAILTECFPGFSDSKTLIVYDEDTALSKFISEAYRETLPRSVQIKFDPTDTGPVLNAMKNLNAGDLVVLIQSTNFRLDAFRIRVHLFSRQIRVIEHPHLSRVAADEIKTYIDALAYDRHYYHRIGPALKKRLDTAKEVRLENKNLSLIYKGPFEDSKLNIGDYSQMKNSGGQFPIGEVFTELKDLTKLNGRVSIFAFGDKNFSVFDCHVPIILEIHEGKIVRTENAPAEFHEILNDIQKLEKTIWVRELGFGLNPALTKKKRIQKDVGIYERMTGVHLSLGAKHTIYPKEGFDRKSVRYHVDVFADVDEVLIDDEVVYKMDRYII